MKTWMSRVRDTYSSAEDLYRYERCYQVISRCGYRSAETL